MLEVYLKFKLLLWLLVCCFLFFVIGVSNFDGIGNWFLNIVWNSFLGGLDY